MSDLENEVVQDSTAPAESVETTETTTTPAVESTEKPAVEAAGGTDADKPTDETVEDPAAVKEVPAFTPNVKFKVLDKEMEIPKEFQSLMKDAASEKMVRELFEKSEGLPLVKTKLNEVRLERDTVAQENHSLKSSIGKARSIYQDAVKTQNLHKLDDFFEILDIPQAHIMAYAIEKAKLAEMDPQQRKLVEENLRADREAAQYRESAQSTEERYAQTDRELRKMQLEMALSKPDTTAMAQAFESQFNKPGLFRDEVIAAGQQAWLMKKEILPVEKAIQLVIEKYNLTAKQAASAPAAAPAAKVVVKPASTIPNVNGSAGSSPLTTSRPRNIEDIKKLRDKMLKEDSAR